MRTGCPAGTRDRHEFGQRLTSYPSAAYVPTEAKIVLSEILIQDLVSTLMVHVSS